MDKFPKLNNENVVDYHKDIDLSEVPTETLRKDLKIYTARRFHEAIEPITKELIKRGELSTEHKGLKDLPLPSEYERSHMENVPGETGNSKTLRHFKTPDGRYTNRLN